MDAEQGQRPGLIDRFPRLFQVQRKGKDKGQLENFRGLEAQSQKRDFEPCPVVDVGIPLLANKIGEEHQPSGNGQIDLPKPGQLAVVEAREKAGPEKAERGCKNLHQKNPQLDIAREINPPEQEGRKGRTCRDRKTAASGRCAYRIVRSCSRCDSCEFLPAGHALRFYYRGIVWQRQAPRRWKNS